MSETSPGPYNPLETVRLLAQQHMESAAMQLEAMLAAGRLGTPLEQDLVVEVQKRYNALRAIFAAAESDDGGAERFDIENGQEPTKVRILAEAVMPASDVSEVGHVLREKLGDVAVEGTVRVDVVAEEALTPRQEQREKYLTMDLATLLDETGVSNEDNKALCTRTINALRIRMGVTTLRDVFLSGTNAISDTYGVSKNSLDLLKSAIETTTIGLRLVDDPGMDDIVDICPSLAYLPAKHYNFAHWEALDPYSVRDILDMTVTEISQLLTGSDSQGIEIAKTLRTDLYKVNAEFTQALAKKIKSSKRQS